MMLWHVSRFAPSRWQAIRSFASDSNSNVMSIRLYRILFRMVDGLDDAFPLQEPLNPRDYGQARLFSMQTQGDSTLDIYKFFANWHQDDPYIPTWYTAVSSFEYNDSDHEEETHSSSLWASKAELKHAIRQAFRKSPTSQDIVAMQKLAIYAFQDIQQQQRMQQRGSVSIDVERGVRVVATSR